MPKTINEVYFERIRTARTDVEIMAAYKAMQDDNGGNKTYTDTNLGYILGYFDAQTYERWFKLLPDVVHPFFGPKFGRGYNPTPKEAFDAGRNWAATNKK